MAAETRESTYFTAEGTRYPKPALYGNTTVQWTGTIDVSTYFTENNDIYLLVPLPYGTGTITRISGATADLDSGAGLDIDFVLRDDNGTTVIQDGGGSLGQAAAQFDYVVSQAWEVATSTTLPGVGIRCTVDPATGVDGTFTLNVEYQQSSVGV